MLESFVIADSVSYTADQKPILYGFYPDKKIVIDPTLQPGWTDPTAQRPMMLAQLGMLATVRDLEPGVGQVSLDIVTPAGPFPAALPKDKPVSVGANGMANLNFQFNGFPAPAFGRYRVIITVNGQQMESYFEIAKL